MNLPNIDSIEFWKAAFVIVLLVLMAVAPLLGWLWSDVRLKIREMYNFINDIRSNIKSNNAAINNLSNLVSELKGMLLTKSDEVFRNKKYFEEENEDDRFDDRS